MTVYVESNYVLELALGQEQAAAAEEIFARAKRRELELAIPSFSLSEPFSTITHRTRRRRLLANELNDQLRDVRRSTGLEDTRSKLEPMASVLEQVGQRETARLISTVDQLLITAAIIQVDLLIFRRGIQYQAQYDLSAQDAIIYAAVVSHLAQNPSAGPHFFISRNRVDFDDPGIASELAGHDCTFVARFDEGVQRLNQPQNPLS